jgi:hypothetical protein
MLYQRTKTQTEKKPSERSNFEHHRADIDPAASGSEQSPANAQRIGLREVVAQYWLATVAGVALAILGRAQTIFFPLYSIDSYSSVYQREGSAAFGVLLPTGRFGLVGLYWLRDLIGYYGLEVAVSSLVLSTLLFAHAGLLFALCIFRKPSNVEATIFITFFVLHPFNTEFFHFSDVTLNIAIAIWLASVGLYVATSVRRFFPAAMGGGLLIVISLSIYQTAIAYLLAACALSLIARFSHLEEDNESLTTSSQVRATMITLASVPIYLVLTRLVSVLTGVALDSRTSLRSLANIQEKFWVVCDAVKKALLPSVGILPTAISVLLIGLLCLCAAILVWNNLRNKRPLIALACLPLLLGALAWSAGATSLSGVVWQVPRALAPISIFGAGLIMLGWRGARTPIIHMLLAGGLVILTISFIGASNRILFDQRRLNLWDMQKTNRILQRLESDPRFGEVRSLAIIGGRWSYSSTLSSAVGDMNVSALAVVWSKVGLFEQATGYRFETPTDEQVIRARAYCRDAQPWPAAQSVAVIDATGVVCLGE